MRPESNEVVEQNKTEGDNVPDEREKDNTVDAPRHLETIGEEEKAIHVDDVRLEGINESQGPPLEG